MKRVLIAMLALVALCITGSAGTRYVYAPKVAPQEVTMGDNTVVFTSDAALARTGEVPFILDGDGVMCAATATAPAAPQFYETTWTSANGVGQRVKTDRRIDESVMTFANRHRDAVNALMDIFPPVPQPVQTGSLLHFPTLRKQAA